jgi:hypothetical protein
VLKANKLLNRDVLYDLSKQKNLERKIKMKKLLLFIFVMFFLPFHTVICQADITKGYDYPFVNAYEATVIGTPEIYAPKITGDIKQKEL